MILVDFPTEKRYNIHEKGASAQTYLKVRVMQHAKRNKKSTNFRRGNASHALWWNFLNSLVLQKTQTQLDFAKLH